MKVEKVTLTTYDYDHAAMLALVGKLAAPASVDASRCEAHLITLNEPVEGTYGNELHTTIVAVVTRGAMGSYAETLGVYAADAEGNILGGDDTAPWNPIINELASRDHGAFILNNIIKDYLS